MMITTPAKSERPDGADPREMITNGRESNHASRPVVIPAKKPFLVDHPIAQHVLTLIRDKHASSKSLRDLSNQLLLILALEATRTMPTRESAVEGPKGEHLGKALSKPVVFVSLSRHGLGLSHNIPNFIPEVSVGSITLRGSSQTAKLEPRLHLANAPSLHDCRVLLFDPVVSSGLSASLALNLLRKSGAIDLGLINFVISAPAIKRVQATVSDVAIWTAAIDQDFDPKSGPIPGIGNFGDRLYAEQV